MRSAQYYDICRVLFIPTVDAVSTADEDIRKFLYNSHHKERTPFLDLKHFNFIKSKRCELWINDV